MGQTISQPYVVALMSQVLIDGRRPRRVLEVGTGSGYQAAILAQLVEKVYGVERIASLVQRAETCIRKLRLHNVYLRHRNGQEGWPERAPFDAILVAAAAAAVPQRLTAQLGEGGKLIIPVGSKEKQELVVIQRSKQGFERRSIERVSFVPLLGGLR
jgi:protein-L-isoaspartate(D-aspartate) O-methyltransferase